MLIATCPSDLTAILRGRSYSATSQLREILACKEDVDAQVEDAQEVISPPHRLTRSKFKELGNSGRLFSLFIVSFVLKGA